MKGLIKFIIFFLLFLSFSLRAHSQALPFIQDYPPKIYGADNQNWSITQSADGAIFIANNKGLLRYDGALWNFYASPNKTTLRSVKAVGNQIYSGAYMEFGVWKHDKNKPYHYLSLSDSISLKDDEQFWNIIDLSQNLVAFQSLDRIYILNTESEKFQQINSEHGISTAVKVQETLYYQKINEGIYKLVNGEEVLVSNLPVFQTNLMVNLYQINGSLYVQTEKDGIRNLQNGAVYIPENAEQYWSNISVYSSLQTRNGDIFIGTIAHGLLKLQDNRIVYHIDKEHGLSNNTVLSLFQDYEKNLWLGLDNGINYVSDNSILRIFNDYRGQLGTVYDIKNFKDHLYLGTNQGLFLYDQKENDFQLIPGTSGQVWSLYSQDSTLFCGHNSGTFIINGNSARLISDIQGTWGFKKWKDGIIQGNYDGLHVLKKIDGEWEYDRKIKGFDISAKYFEFSGPHSILINHEYKGVFLLHLDDSFTRVLKYEKISSAPKGLYSSIVSYQGQILYAYENGIYRYHANSNTFSKDSVLSQLFENGEYISGKLIKDSHGAIWAFTKNDISQIVPGALEGKSRINRFPIPNDVRNQITGEGNVSEIGSGVFLFGNTKGYFSIDIKKYNPPTPGVELHKIYKKQKEDHIGTSLDPKEETYIAHAYNSLTFHYASKNLNPFYKVEYQHKLEGYDNSWSNWSRSSKASYENLRFGDYTFKVRSRIGTENQSSIKTFGFTIKRPFALSNLMLLVYGIVAIALMFGIHTLYRTHYKRKQEKLKAWADRELKIKENEAQKRLVEARNENLRQDIENKSNELAISTMSLLKKNTFLSAIRDDISDIKGNLPGLKKIVDKINKNLNSTDDWEFFETAFNNADKDFLKKIKRKHPKLTPDDLKLCAYLRLNLSSKEIAPLFNISTKSVEVKRYRLRKKMDLSREQNLVNYILEI